MRLHPDRNELHFTRALVAVSLGRAELARAEVEAGAPHDERIEAFLRDYVRVIFPAFEIAPREAPETHYDELPAGPAQSLGAVQLAVRKYATRLLQLREEMLLRVGGVEAWMPPDLSALLPDGEEDLDVSSFESEGTTVEIDELPSIGDQADLPGLLRQARGDWAALSWLLWSVGERELRLPTEVKPPEEFGKAAGMASQRLWHCRDRIQAAGSAGREYDVPGFTWEGKDIDSLHPFVVAIAEHEYAEIQAMFRWLSEETNRSPWQDDLRES
jgi:hypothetical protein